MLLVILGGCFAAFATSVEATEAGTSAVGAWVVGLLAAVLAVMLFVAAWREEYGRNTTEVRSSGTRPTDEAQWED